MTERRYQKIKLSTKNFENSKLCPMAATKEYLKRRAEYNVTHTKVLFTTVSHFGPPHKETIARWVKNTLAQAGMKTNIFLSHSCRSSAAVRLIIWAWDSIPY